MKKKKKKNEIFPYIYLPYPIPILYHTIVDISIYTYLVLFHSTYTPLPTSSIHTPIPFIYLPYSVYPYFSYTIVNISIYPGTLAKGLACAHFGEKDQRKLKNETVG